MTMMRDVSFKCDGEASSGERGAKWQWCEMSTGRRIPVVRAAGTKSGGRGLESHIGHDRESRSYDSFGDD